MFASVASGDETIVHSLLSVDLEWGPIAPTVARRIVATWLLGQQSLDGAIEDVALVVSELVTRAIDGARRDPHLEATRTADELRIHVSSPVPIELTPSDDPFDAIGPLVLAALCIDWGVRTTGDGTTQWARLDLASPRPR
jgi:hypothetical protein